MKKVLLLSVLSFVFALPGTALANWNFTYEYTVDASPDNGCPYRVRGIAVFGEDDVVGTNSGSTVDMANYVYQNCTGGQDGPDASPADWINPDLGTDSNLARWGWGVDISPVDGYIYGTYGGPECPVLTWDTSGNSIKFAASTRQQDTGVHYTAALDMDSSGYVYISGYGAEFEEFTGGAGADLIVLPPATALGPWEGTNINDITRSSGHNPLPTAFVDSGHFIDEGACVKPDGTVLWITDRAAGSGSFVHRWTGTPTGGYTLDGAFTYAGGDGSCRGMDCTDDGAVIFVCHDDGTTPSGSYVNICDGATGALLQTLDVTTATGGTDAHNSAYEVEVTSDPYGSPAESTGNINLWVCHLYSWYIDKWQGTFVPAVDDWTLY